MTNHDATKVRDQETGCWPLGPMQDRDEIGEEYVKYGSVLGLGAFGSLARCRAKTRRGKASHEKGH